MNLNSNIIRKNDIDVVEFNNENVMMDIENGKYYALNSVGSDIWNIIENKTTVSDIVNLLLEEYDIDKESCIDEVMKYLNDLDKENLIIVS